MPKSPISDRLWRWINYFFGFLAISVLLWLTVVLSNIEIKDLDIWLHIGMGRFIVANLYVPAHDILSCTIHGAPWVNHEWLFQVASFLTFDRFGPEGLITMQMLVVGVTLMILLFLGYDKDKQFIIVFTLLLVLLVYELRFTNRPDLFSLLFFALYIFILSLFIDRKISLYLLVFIQILWTNMHGFFFFGPLFVLIGLTTEWVKRHIKLPYEWNDVGRLNDDEYRRLKAIFIFVTLACLINPLTFQGAIYPIKVFFQISGDSKIFFENITELQKPILSDQIFTLNDLPYFKLLILISFISFVLNRRNIDIGALVFWLLFLVFALKAIRNIPFFAFAAYLVTVTNAMSLSFKDIIPIRFTDRKFQHVTEVVLKILLIVWMLDYGMNVMARGYFDWDEYERKSERYGISQRNFPNKAVDFLLEQKIRGNIMNDFNSGAYLVGRAFPQIRVFIDGRTEVYGPEFFKFYQKVYEQGDEKLLTQTLKDSHISIALFNTNMRSVPVKTMKYFYNNKEWAPVYFDYDGLIFLKKIPPYKETIRQYAIDLAKWKPKNVDFLRLGARPVEPFQQINRAFVLEDLELYDPAIEEAELAIKIDPTYTDAYNLLGTLNAKKKQYKKAFENYRIAAILHPGARSIRYNLAQSYYDLGEYGNAIHQYNKLIGHRSDDAQAYFLMSRALIKEKKYDESVDLLRKAHALSPSDLNDLLQIGDLLFEDKENEKAKITYEMALTTKKDEVKVRLKLASVYKALNDNEKAIVELQKAHEFAPDNEAAIEDLRKLGVNVSKEE